MDKFLEQWKEDKKFRAKVKLLLYGLFIIGATIYAVSLSNTEALPNDLFDNTEVKEQADLIAIPDNYEYHIDITIDEDEFFRWKEFS